MKGNSAGKRDNVADHGNVLVKSAAVNLVSEDVEVSFSLNLFPKGFYIGKASELLYDLPKQLHPFDRASESLLTAIEYGWLPGDTIDGLSCKFVNGGLLCEEVESCMLKALQPNLHLNPKPFLDRFCKEPLTKKLDLGITWVWKKRKLTDATANDSRFSGQYNKGVPNSQLNISGSICISQKNNIVPRSIPQHNVLTMKRRYQLADRCSRSVLSDLSSSNLTSVPKQCFVECNHHPREPSVLVSYGQGASKSQANNRPIFKKPKQEASDFSQQHPAMSQPVNILVADLLKNNTSLHHEAKTIPHGILHDKRGLSSVLRNNYQQATFEGIRKLQALMAASTLKQEPICRL